MNSSARLKTESAQRYLEALCQHFGRKVETQCSAGQGWVQFSFGRCEMRADAVQLEMTASAEDDNALDQVTRIVTSHLERYAFHENPRLEWEASASQNASKEKSK